MTDSDCEVYPEWIVDMIIPLINKECDCVQGSQINITNDFWSKHIQMKHLEMKDIENKDRILGRIDSKNFAIKTNALKRVDFTSRKYITGNDTELSIRLHKNNIVLKFLEDVKIKHYHANTLKAVIMQQFSRGYCCAIMTKEYKGYLKHTDFLKITNQTAWTFFKFLPGLIRSLTIKQAYFEFVTGIAWRAGLLRGMFCQPFLKSGP